jgi:hypothetical protein
MTENKLKRTPVMIGLFAGLIPLAVGMVIFFSYWYARTYHAYDLKSIVDFGLIWLAISVTASSIGLILLVIFIHQHNALYIARYYLGVLMILVAYPILLWVLNVLEDMNERAYFKLENESKMDDLQILMKGTSQLYSFGSIERDESRTFWYYPKYLDESEFRLDTYIIVGRCGDVIFEAEMPDINRRDCKHFKIDSEFKLIDIQQ